MARATRTKPVAKRMLFGRPKKAVKKKKKGLSAAAKKLDRNHDGMITGADFARTKKYTQKSHAPPL